MVILITGASRVRKTFLAQKMLEKYKFYVIIGGSHEATAWKMDRKKVKGEYYGISIFWFI